MGSLILCRKKKAEQPYEITRIHRKIYTIEELCYYLCNNLYLIDYTIMNEKICEWLYLELDMKDLAKELLELMQRHGTIEQFVLKILGYAKIYTKQEMEHIQNVLDRLKNQKEIERRKYKADNLLESGECEAAILVYLSILQEKRDETMERFYGKVYGCLGAAYGREFLYKESAAMYEQAYKICGDETMLRAYLYACSRYMKEEDYQDLILTNEMYLSAAEEIENKENETEREQKSSGDRTLLEKWKRQYRRYQ
ncbi:hypothetical protein B5F13_10155 [Drancourtella sp. An177]|nr:hypothetical protein B5F13_10155 [Drancourtella sp. An177]